MYGLEIFFFSISENYLTLLLSPQYLGLQNGTEFFCVPCSPSVLNAHYVFWSLFCSFMFNFTLFRSAAIHSSADKSTEFIYNKKKKKILREVFLTIPVAYSPQVWLHSFGYVDGRAKKKFMKNL